MDPYTTSPYKIVEIIERKQNSPDIKFQSSYWMNRELNPLHTEALGE